VNRQDAKNAKGLFRFQGLMPVGTERQKGILGPNLAARSDGKRRTFATLATFAVKIQAVSGTEKGAGAKP
jgi:hypothetical protein